MHRVLRTLALYAVDSFSPTPPPKTVRSVVRGNFCSILHFGLEIHECFPELQKKLTCLYKEVEEVQDALENPTQDKDISKEISDVIRAWEAYKESYQPDLSLQPFMGFLTKEKVEFIEQSFAFLRQGLGKESATISLQEYQQVIEFIEDYSGSHNPLADTLDKNDDEIFVLLKRRAIVQRLKLEIQNLILHIDKLVYKHTGNMMKNLTKIICCN